MRSRIALHATALGLSLLLGLAGGSARAATWGEVVRGMAARAPEAQRQFAALALAELIERHEHEINRAARSKAGWQRGMRGYVARLQEMSRLVEAGESVRLVREAAGEVRMIVGRTQVMLATPNPGGQYAFERAVLDAWCAEVDCTGAAAKLADAPVAPASVPPPAAEATTPVAIDASQAPVPPPMAPAVPAIATEGAAPAAASSDALEAPASPSTAPVAGSGSALPGVRATPSAASSAPAAALLAEADGVKRFATADAPLPAPATALPPVVIPAPAVAAGATSTASTASTARPVVHLSPATGASAPGAVRGGWAFGDRTPPLYAADDGLQCAFADLRHLKLKQAACAAVLRELRELLALLREEHVAGRRVELDQLKLRPAGVDAPALLQLAAGARPVPIRAPYLSAAPEVLAGAHPWLQARLAGQTLTYRIEAPEALGYLAPPTLVSAP